MSFGTNSFSLDTDGDGIPAGYEIRTEYWEYEHNRTVWYYISLAAAVFGLTISELKLLFPPMDKDAKIKVDGILLIVSIVSFVSWLKIIKDPRWSWKQFLAEITTKIEFFLALGGVISLGINLINDISAPQGGGQG